MNIYKKAGILVKTELTKDTFKITIIGVKKVY